MNAKNWLCLVQRSSSVYGLKTDILQWIILWFKFKSCIKNIFLDFYLMIKKKIELDFVNGTKNVLFLSYRAENNVVAFSRKQFEWS